jgi:hypothetical protein
MLCASKHARFRDGRLLLRDDREPLQDHFQTLHDDIESASSTPLPWIGEVSSRAGPGFLPPPVERALHRRILLKIKAHLFFHGTVMQHDTLSSVMHGRKGKTRKDHRSQSVEQSFNACFER